jgi:hypothetical protein
VTGTYSSALAFVLPTVAVESPGQYDAHTPTLSDPEDFLHDRRQSSPAPNSAVFEECEEHSSVSPPIEHKMI